MHSVLHKTASATTEFWNELYRVKSSVGKRNYSSGSMPWRAAFVNTAWNCLVPWNGLHMGKWCAVPVTFPWLLHTLRLCTKAAETQVSWQHRTSGQIPGGWQCFCIQATHTSVSFIKSLIKYYMQQTWMLLELYLKTCAEFKMRQNRRGFHSSSPFHLFCLKTKSH